MMRTGILAVLILSLVAAFPAQVSGELGPNFHQNHGVFATATWGTLPNREPASPFFVRVQAEDKVTKSMGESALRFQGAGFTVILRDSTGRETFHFSGFDVVSVVELLEIREDLTSAAVRVTSRGLDRVSGNTATITLEVSWEASGIPDHELARVQTNLPDYWLVSSGMGRQGIAVGSLSGDVEMNLGPTTIAFLTRLFAMSNS